MRSRRAGQWGGRCVFVLLSQSVSGAVASVERTKQSSVDKHGVILSCPITETQLASHQPLHTLLPSYLVLHHTRPHCGILMPTQHRHRITLLNRYGDDSQQVLHEMRLWDQKARCSAPAVAILSSRSTASSAMPPHVSTEKGSSTAS